MNKWKIGFWFSLTTLLIFIGFGIHSTIDQGDTLAYLQD